LIAQSTIDKVYEIARVEEVIGDYVQLKKSGANYKGLSPFNSEKTPSFMVSPVKQIWKDFSSGKGGNVIAFLMELEHFTYPEAIKHLARKYGIEVEETVQDEEQKKLQDHKESLYLVNQFAAHHFEDLLNRSETGRAIGLSYFEERGFTSAIIKKFGLGFGGTSFDGLVKAAQEKGHQINYLTELGLCIEKDGSSVSYFDRFRDRVIFPIHSNSGRVLGFGGRILDNQKKVAKYINSPESPIYHKSKVLYGIYYAKSAMAKANNCYLVEGYTDVIQLHQNGIENVVSSSGTALSESQIRMIQRLCQTITVLFDGDDAGVRASLRNIDLILKEGMNVRVVPFAQGEDPDSFARTHSPAEVKDYLEEQSVDFISFKTQVLLKEAGTDSSKVAAAIRDLVSSIACIPDPISQELYIRQTAKDLEVSEGVLFASLADLTAKQVRDSKKATKRATPLSVVSRMSEQKKPEVNRLEVLESALIKTLLLYGNQKAFFEDEVLKEGDEGEIVTEKVIHEMKVYEKIFLELQQDELAFSNVSFQALFKRVMEFYVTADEEVSMEKFIRSLSSENDRVLVDIVSNILLEDEQYFLHDWQRKNIFAKSKEDSIDRLVTETILSLRSYLLDMQIKNLQEASKQDAHAIEEVMDYLQLGQLLNKKLNRVLSL
jgi:DNA primase